jgi:hypothetical protein
VEAGGGYERAGGDRTTIFSIIRARGAAVGSFVLTGSTQADLTAAGWPATGRLIRVLMYGLAERELEHGSSRPPVLGQLVSEGTGALPVPPESNPAAADAASRLCQ